jgi:flagellin-like protein
MNVFGKNERSWRKARKRGVSPIIATILLVAITVVLAAVLYVLISGLTSGGVGSKPIGGAFSAGSPIVAKATAGTYATTGCLSGDYCYTLTVETTGATFSNVLFEVKTANGAVYQAASAGGFTVLSISLAIAAQSAVTVSPFSLAMSSTFGTYGASPICNGVACGPSTPWSSIYTIEIDMGTANPTGQGYSFVAVGTGGYSGTTSLALP